MKPIDFDRPCRSGDHLIHKGQRQCIECRDLAAIRRALGGPRRKWEHRTHQTAEAKREARNTYQRAWKAAHPTPPDVVRDRNLRASKGITLAQWDALYTAQGGLCLLCAKPLGADAVVDHDHKTDDVRGLTHRLCNRVISIFGDNPAVAAAFLQAYADKARARWAAKVIAAAAEAPEPSLCGPGGCHLPHNCLCARCRAEYGVTS